MGVPLVPRCAQLRGRGNAKSIRYTEMMPLYCVGSSTLPLWAAVIAILISGCAALPQSKDTQPKDEPKSASSTQAQTNTQAIAPSAPVMQDLARTEPVTSAWAFLERALDAEAAQAQLLFLASAQRFLQAMRLEQAEIILNRTQFLNANPWVVRQHTLLRAALALARKNLPKARGLLARAENTELDDGQWFLVNDLKLQILFAEKNPIEALNLINTLSLDNRSGADVGALLARVFDALSMLTLQERNLLKQHPDIAEDSLAWLELVQIISASAWALETLRLDLDDWSARYPGHRATPLRREFRPASCASPTPASIALLLPMTSAYSKAALAFNDGFMHLHNGDHASSRPVVSLYDFGDDINTIGEVYQAAVEAGADLVVGPLGRDAVASLVTQSTLSVPTLLLGSSNTERTPNAFFIDLSRRSEALSLVTHARARGLENALVLYTLTKANKAAADTAVQAWQDQGGQITDTVIVDSTRSDFSEMISRMLSLSQIEAQTNALQNTLGDTLPLVVVPRIRRDLDVILLFADQKTARLLKPQIDFHHAGKLPIYSQNTVFTGTPDPVNDLDLEGVLFSDMPWLVRRTGRFERSDKMLTVAGHYQGSGVDRLFALGMDAYRLGCEIQTMSDDSTRQVSGASGIYFLQGGDIEKQSDWVIFRQGIPEPFTPVISR